MEKGLSGNIAKGFLQSKLTILLMVAFLLIGGYSTMLMPREEEPQIKVPMADIFLGYPGASPKDVETKVAAPMEKIISNIKGVEYVYSTSMKGQVMLIVQFYVGEDVEKSMVKLYSELLKNMDKIPQGTTMPLIKTRAIDDVPVLSFTLWGENYDDHRLKLLGQEVANEVKKIPNVSDINILGGRSKEIKVVLDKTKMTSSHVDFLSITKAIQASNTEMASCSILLNDTSISVQTGNFLTSADDVAGLVVGMNAGMPVYLKQVAKIEEAPATSSQYVFFGYGKADTLVNKYKATYPAVTFAIAKKQGADAMKLSEEILHKITALKKDLIPTDVQVSTTRNYGESAADKVGELLFHLFIAIVVVTLFVMLAMGWRGGLVVFLSVPVTFALTLFAYYALDYTLNRITLFALVFITGIVVDDSIIIAENMHRHFKMRKLPPLQAAIYAINEVGNPTILATFTVVAAVLPMAFVSGLMGPYMSPMPIGASIAMLLSLIVALTLTPYLGYIFLREKEKHGVENNDQHGEKLEDSGIYKIYKAVIQPMLQERWKRWAFVMGTVVVLLASMVLFYTKSVAVKMLPFDNKNEFQVVIDMPEGTTLEKTQVVASDIAAYVGKQPMVENYQAYVGTSGPISFNGLVRHYDLRHGENVADIQVNLVDKTKRSIQSHDIAKSMRAEIINIGKTYNANVKIVELPPGPPVLSTLVAEIYGPNYDQQIEIGKQVKTLFTNTEDVVDADWMVEDDEMEYKILVDKEKAMKYGVVTAQVSALVNGALSGMIAGNISQSNSYSQIPVRLQLKDADKTSIEDVLSLNVVGMQGNMVPLRDIVKVQSVLKDKSIYRKNQKEVVYVMADMAGKLESPFYAI